MKKSIFMQLEGIINQARKRSRLSMAMLFLFVPFIQSKYIVNREDALLHLDQNISRIHEIMDTKPEEVNRSLIWEMAMPIGYHPKILNLCNDILAHAKNQRTLTIAVDAIGSMIDYDKKNHSLSSDQINEIKESLNKGLKNPNVDVVVRAVTEFDRLLGHPTPETEKILFKQLEKQDRKVESGIMKSAWILCNHLIPRQDVDAKRIREFISQTQIISSLETIKSKDKTKIKLIQRYLDILRKY